LRLAALVAVVKCQMPEGEIKECYTIVDGEKNKIQYWGVSDQTKSGKQCQAWDSQVPHEHKKTSARYPNKDLRKNYCRDPDNLGYPWCFTMDPEKKRERCAIPNCADLVEDVPTSCYEINKESGSVMYAGLQNTTTRGLECQKWSVQTPHEHQRSPSQFPGKGLGDHNYCRDPDGTGYPWCYTADAGVRWESCPVDPCNAPTEATEVTCIDLRSQKKYYVGDTWNPEVCALCECFADGEVGCAKITCDYPVGCDKVIEVRGECCPVCDTGCQVGDVDYREGERWAQDECTTCECTIVNGRKQTICATVDCPMPILGCEPMYIDGQCCPVCSGQCLDQSTGEEYPLDATWKPDPCTECTCYDANGTKAEICSKEYCAIPDYCYNVTRAEGECCAECGVSGYEQCFGMTEDLTILYDGKQAYTESGLVCQDWTMQSPHAHARTADNYPEGLLGVHNYCRDPDNSGYLWCYTMDENVRYEKCNVTACAVPTPEYEGGATEEVMEEETCYTKQGRFSKYEGTKSTTATGRQCQRWNQQRPHTHHFGNMSEAGTGAHPYCRDPDGEGYPWCYTMDPAKRWESCNISRCEGDITTPEAAGPSKVAKIVRLMVDAKDNNCQYTKEDNSRVQYFGKQNTTKSGIPCQKWTETSPHFHTKFPDKFPNAGLGDHNFCRDPDGNGQLWCYTTDPDTRFEYCDVQECTAEQIEELSVCDDVDCGVGGDCIMNLAGEPACMCKVGYYGFDKTCWDTNECLRAASCPGDNVTCTNTDGGFTCDCDEGFYRDGDECLSSAPADPACPVIPDFVIKPFNRHDIKLQDAFDCECEAADNATIWWTKGLDRVEVNGTRGFGSSTLKFDMIRKKDIDVYHCVIQDQCSKLIRTAYVDVHAQVKPCIEGGLQKYGMVWDPKSWDEAFGYCQSYGLTFAVPKSKTDNRKFIQDAWRSYHLNPNGKKFRDVSWVWIAANDRLEENTFTDVHGVELSAPKWWPENPDNWKDMDGRGQDEICLHRLGGYWDDSYGWIPRPFACDCKFD